MNLVENLYRFTPRTGIIAAACILAFSACRKDDSEVLPLLTTDETRVVEYFKEVALGFEYGDNSQVVRKWNSDMLVYMSGNTDSVLQAELATITDDLNALFTDKFHMSITHDSIRANFIIYTGGHQHYGDLFPQDAQGAVANAGLFRVYWDSLDVIISGHAFIDTDRIVDPVIRKHLLREELTQALGLGRDSYRYQNSIFQQDWTQVTEFSELDRTLIYLLYNPLIRPGMSDDAQLTFDLIQALRTQ